MARSLSSTLKGAMYASESSEALVTLIEIDHASLGTPLRYCDAEADVTSNGDVYTAAAFRISLPKDAAGAPPRVTLDADGIDRSIIESIRAFSTYPDIDLSMVLASAPNSIECGPYPFIVDDISWNQNSLRASLTFEPILNEAIPADKFTPNTFPGIFA